MSLSSEIRAVLRSAPGPLTAREVREELGDNYTAEQVGSNLSSLTKFGELIRDGELGKFTYLLDPKFKPKRQRDDAVAVPPPTRKPAVSKARALTIKKSPALSRAIVRAAIENTTSESLALATMPRDSLRTLALAFTALHPEPMAADVRDAVVGAFKATL